MTSTDKPTFVRRDFLRGALAIGVGLPLSAMLASCAGSGGDPTGAAHSAATSASNPFGIKKGSKVDAVIFNGGYGYDYVTFATKEVDKKWGTTTKVNPETNIAQSLQPRFASGNPPDVVQNDGANQIGFNTILSELDTLDDVFEANNYEGTKIADTIYPHVKEPGTFKGRFVAMNYVMAVYGVWYSASLFDEYGWQPPKTWDEAIDLGAEAKKKDKYLFVWGKEAATYYLTLALDSAIKEGGLEVRDAVNTLKPKAWSQSAIQKVLSKIEEIVKRGYFIPGGAGTQFTAAQAKWSSDEKAILYPSGNWIQNEMKKATKSGFKMTAAPTPTLTTGSKLPYAALHATAAAPFIVPTKAENGAAGKEILRALLSKDAAANFAKTKLSPTIVKDTVPSDGFGSTALQSVTKMMDAAGDHTFDWEFGTLYGLNTDQLVVWNDFLSGSVGVKRLTDRMQEISDKAAARQ